MKKTIIITILSFSLIFMLAAPSMALSELGERFVRACYSLSAPFPPPDWDKLDLKDAALEVLDEVERGYLNPELVNFCVIAIGHVGDPNDFHRIMKYKDSHEFSVIRALNGFSHPDAIKHLLGYLEHEEIPQRELAAMSLGSMDFNKLDKPMEWYEEVRDSMIEARDKEETDWLRDFIQEKIDKLKVPEIHTD